MRMKTTIVRDFAGGLNIVDDDLNLDSAYQVVLDNIHRGVDSSLTVRWGYELFANLEDGAEVEYNDGVMTNFMIFSTTNGSREVNVEWTAHPFSNREHIRIYDQVNVGGLELNQESVRKDGQLYGVRKVDANNFRIISRDQATSTTTSGSIAPHIRRDNHMLADVVREVNYYDDHLVVVDAIGEICKIDAEGTKTRIWDIAFSNALSGSPLGWTMCDFVSSDVFKGELIICNGEDKPLIVNFTAAQEVSYLVDIPTGSNTNVPVCRYVKSIGQWLVMAGDPDFPYRVHISATDTSGTWFGDPAPNDAVQVDVNNVANSPSQIIRGIAKFRDFCVVAFDDTHVLIELGIFDGADHTPNVNDTIAKHGSVSHKAMIFLGYDLVSCDPIGVTSIAKSIYDSTVVPTRLSEFIAPMLQKNIGRLTTATLQDKMFAVYSTHDTRYMLFMPDFEDGRYPGAEDELQTQHVLPTNAFHVTDEIVGTNLVFVNIINHGLETGDTIYINDLADSIGGIPFADINGLREVVGVLNEDFIVIEADSESSIAENAGSASGVPNFGYIKSESRCYVYTYNKGLKVKTWARYRDMNFVAGTTSVYGRVFLCTDHRVWRMGNRFEPMYADLYNNYDSIWANNTAYTTGHKAYDPNTNETYTCQVNHTSAIAGTFAEARTDDDDLWEIYDGEPIEFVVELPWADFGEREKLKKLKNIGVDAKGNGQFNLQLFLDYFYKSADDGTLTPELDMEFVGGDTGGYGVGSQPYGSGRIATRQRLWPYYATAKLFKLRIAGETIYPLKFVSFTFRYGLGGTAR